MSAPAPPVATETAQQAAVPAHRRTKAPPSTPQWLFYLFLLAFALEYSGLPNGYKFLKTFHVATALTYLVVALTLAKVGIGDLFKHRQGKILLTFLILTILSMLWAVVRMRAYDSIRPFVDYLFLYYLMANLVDRPKRFVVFSILLAIVTAYLVSQNLGRLGQDLRIGSYAAAYFMGDGNDFAWGLAVMMPFTLYLVMVPTNFIVRLIGVAGLAISVYAIIGTSSRGGSLGVGAAILFYWWFMSRNKWLGVGVMAALVVVVLALAPATYKSRMGGLSDTSADSSAQARITTWKASMKMAIDYPLGVGAGNFSSAYGRFYIGAGNPALGSSQNRWFSAHSIYFRTLGEYGYLGVALLIWLIVFTTIDNMRVRTRLLAQGENPQMPVAWPSLVAMAVVAFAICGIFLGGLSYPHLFMLCGLTVANKRIVGLLPMADTVRGRIRGRARPPLAGPATSNRGRRA